MAIYVTTGGFFGGFAVRPKRIKDFGPDGQKVYSTPIRMVIVPIGIEASTKNRVGFFDTEKLPFRTEMACKEVYGDDWQKKLVAEIDGLHMPLRKIEDESDMPEIASGGIGPRIINTMRTVASTKATAANVTVKPAAPGPRPVKKAEK